MNIDFGVPLSKGWNRMKKALFQPFDISKWFAVGFTAFLAGLADCQGNGGGSNYSNQGRNFDWDEFLNFPHTAHEWLISHPLYFSLIVIGIGLVFIISIVMTWLSSRGKFMLLYNVVNDAAEVKKPWFDFKKEGNSLFLWRFVFGVLVLIVFAFFLIFCFDTIKEIYYKDLLGIGKAWAILKMIFFFLGLMIVVGYISLFLSDFVVPIMYKYKITATRGWSLFFKILWRHFGYFIVYGLFVFLLTLVVVFAIVLACIFTCCLGFLVLLIPYISSVVLLPVSYTYRAFSVGFLEQFGEEYTLFPKPVEGVNEVTEF